MSVSFASGRRSILIRSNCLARSIPRLLQGLLAPFRTPKAKPVARNGNGKDGRRASAKMDAAAKEMARLIAKHLKSEIDPAKSKARRNPHREEVQKAKAAARKAARTFSVVSFPKSGRTWLRVMLDGLKLEAEYTHDGSGHSRIGHVESIQPMSEVTAGKPVVFLLRDPRDTVVSGFFQTSKRLGGYRGTISDFVRDPHHGVEKIVRFNMEWLARGPELGGFHAVTYEDLKADAAGSLAAIVAFVGAKRGADQIAAAVQEASFESMQARERSGELAGRYGKILAPTNADDPQSFKVREGVVGGFRNHLGDEDITFCDAVIARLGYPLERHGSQDA